MDNISTLSERSLIENCINRNRKSQKELYRRFSEKMFVICLHYARNQVEAEYILQEGFLKLFSNIDRFDGRQPFEIWIKRIFVKIAREATRNNADAGSENPEKMIEVKNGNTLDNLYEKALTKTSEKCMKNFHSAFKLYAVKGYLNNEGVENGAFSEIISNSELGEEEILPAGAYEKNFEVEKKKINFLYTIQSGDQKRINKNGILRVYHLSEPIDIPVGRILGKWKKEHIGVTLVAINGKWCIKGGIAEYSIPKHEENVSLPLQLFRKLVR
jgi:RNA polymerase sigma-70 factor (ECF subfamily)